MHIHYNDIIIFVHGKPFTYNYNKTIPADVTVQLYGSSASGFALTGSDVNLTLNIPGVQEKKVNCVALP